MKRYFVIAFLVLIALAIYGLDRGVYIGSSSYTWLDTRPEGGGLVFKKCRYLFVTGISELPAHGSSVPSMPGVQQLKEPDKLYCRFFGE